MILVFSGAVNAANANVKVVLTPFDTQGAIDPAVRRSVMEEFASGFASIGVEISGIAVLKDIVLVKGIAKFDAASARAAAKAAGADFAVFGSIIKEQGQVSVKWRLIDAVSGAMLAEYAMTAEKEEKIGEIVRDSIPAMREKMTESFKGRIVERSGIVDGIAAAGNRRIDAAAVLNKIKSRVGEPFSPDNVKDDIVAIYATGYFDDVSADFSETASGRLLTFIVKEMPFIKLVEFKGNKEVSDEKIKAVLTVKANTVLDKVLLANNADKIKALYLEEGYYLAAITPVVKSDGVEATVRFEVVEGPPIKVRNIVVIGTRFFAPDDVRGFMATKEAGYWSSVTGSGKFNEFTFENDLAMIMGRYFDEGFINADIVDHRVMLSQDKTYIDITIAISEGERYSVGSIEVRGDMIDDLTAEDLAAKIKLKKGEKFVRSKLSMGIDAIAEVFGEKGYAYADIKPETINNEQKKIIDINIDVKKNELVYLERVDISGNVKTQDRVIRREVEVGEGDLYSTSAIKRSRNNLKRLGYFEDVRFSQSQGSAADRIKLDLGVTERPTGAVSVGIGYSSFDKLIGTASISQNNFLGTAIAMDVSATVSASSSRYNLGFTEPWFMDKPISVGFDVFNTERDYTVFTTRTKGFDIRAGSRLNDRYTRGYLTYTLEDINMVNIKDYASDMVKRQAGKSLLSSVRVSVKRDTRDDAFFPSEGSVIQASTTVAGGPLGGTQYFIKYELDAVKFFPLPWLWDTAFSVRGAAGFVQGFESRAVPVAERYYLGGIYTVRGFKTRSLGPVDASTGEVLGGRTMGFLNFEWLYPLLPQQNVKGVVFYDIGNAWAGDKGKMEFGNVRHGAGLGIRWYSPIGPLRLEWGLNLDKRPNESDHQWDFTIGTMF